jgi:serine/threonine protein kinase
MEFLIYDAIALCDIWDILYRQRITHKDNILINPETKQVKLIDFSIASLLPRETQSLKNPLLLWDTLRVGFFGIFSKTRSALVVR